MEQYHAAVTVYQALYSHCAVTIHSHDAPAIVNHAIPESLCNNHSVPGTVHSHNTPVAVLSHSALHNHCVQVTMSQSPGTSPLLMQSQHPRHFAVTVLTPYDGNKNQQPNKRSSNCDVHCTEKVTETRMTYIGKI